MENVLVACAFCCAMAGLSTNGTEPLMFTVSDVCFLGSAVDVFNGKHLLCVGLA